LYKEEPPCYKNLPECPPRLLPENVLIYEVYWRTFGTIEGIDVFKIMALVGIKEIDILYCLDSIQYARNEVLKMQQEEREKEKK